MQLFVRLFVPYLIIIAVIIFIIFFLLCFIFLFLFVRGRLATCSHPCTKGSISTTGISHVTLPYYGPHNHLV